MKTCGPFCLLLSPPWHLDCDWQHNWVIVVHFFFLPHIHTHRERSDARVCDVKKKGNRLRGERKLSSQPQEVGLPEGCVSVSETEALGRGLKAGASCCKDMNCVLVCLQKSSDSYKVDESEPLWLMWVSADVRRVKSENLVSFSHGS